MIEVFKITHDLYDPDALELELDASADPSHPTDDNGEES